MVTPQEPPGMRDRIKSLLMSAACRQIDFTFQGIQVNRFLYEQVAHTLSVPAVAGTIGPNGSRAGGKGILIELGSLPPENPAKYLSQRDAFVFRNPQYGANTYEESIIVHESTHAVYDILNHMRPDTTPAQVQRAGITNTTKNNELVAYLAGVLYEIYRTKGLSGQFRKPWQGQRAPWFEQAYSLAANIWDKPGTNISPNDAQGLSVAVGTMLQSIGKDPNQATLSDGIPLE